MEYIVGLHYDRKNHELTHIKAPYNTQDIKSFGKGTLCQGAMADECSSQDSIIKVVFIVVG